MSLEGEVPIGLTKEVWQGRRGPSRVPQLGFDRGVEEGVAWLKFCSAQKGGQKGAEVKLVRDVDPAAEAKLVEALDGKALRPLTTSDAWLGT